MRGAGAVRAVMVVAVIAALAVAVLASWRAPDIVAISGYTQTVTGPLGPADRDMLDKVKQAGLWEMPAGDDLAARARDPKIREIGKKISAEHHELDRIVENAAAQVGVTLTTQATVEQQDWVRQIAAADNPDTLAVNLLRQAHGKVLPLLAQVKVGTRNETVRMVATGGMEFVGRHIAYLESTGLVDYTALPEPPAPVAAVSPVRAAYYAAADRPTLAFAAAVVAVIVALLAGRFLRPRTRPTPTPPQTRHRRRQ